MALSPCCSPTMQALVPPAWVWGQTFLLLCGTLQQTGAEATATPGCSTEQGPWRCCPEGGVSRGGGRESRRRTQAKGLVQSQPVRPQDHSMGVTLKQGSGAKALGDSWGRG